MTDEPLPIAEDAVPPLPDGSWTLDAPELPMPEPAAAEPAEPSTPPPPHRILEAMLFVGGAPLTAERAQRLVRGLTLEQFTAAVTTLNRAYRDQNRPYAILPQGAGYVLTLRPRFLFLQEKLFGSVREARLSTAAIDVLALVAYRQPLPKSEIDTMRGAESGSLLKQLVRRGLVEVVRRADADSKEANYGTTPRFLELFGLQSLDDLPKTQEVGLG